MSIKFSAKKLIDWIIAVLVCVFAGSGSLLSVIFKSSASWNLMALALFAAGCAAMICRRINPGRTAIWAGCLALVFLNNNYHLGQRNFMPLLVFMSVLLLCCVSRRDISWAKYTLKLLNIIYFVYAAATIVFYFTPSFYKGVVVNLFPDSSAKLIQLYDQGCMAGLTNHYSQNAMFIAAGLLITAAGLLKTKKKKWTEIVHCLIMIVALLLTGKRGQVIFAAAAVFAMYYFYTSNNKRTRLFKIFGAVFAAVCAASIVLTVFPALSTFIVRFQQGMDAGDITANRTMFWALAKDLFMQHKLIGVGWSQFQAYSSTVLSYAAHTHNIYLQLLCEVGIIGTVVYLGWFVYNYINAAKLYKFMRKNAIGSGYALRLVGFSLCFQTFFLLYGFTGNPLYDEEVYILYFISCSIGIYYSGLMRRIRAKALARRGKTA